MVIVFGCLWIVHNTGLKAFEKYVLSIQLPENVERISMKSGIGDSGGNGDYSTYRNVFESDRNFRLIFDDLKNVEDFSNYYFIEFIK